MKKYINKIIGKNNKNKKEYLDLEVDFEGKNYYGTFKVKEETEEEMKEQKFTVSYFEKFMAAYSAERDRILDEKFAERDRKLKEELDERDKNLEENILKMLDEKLKPIIEDLEYLKSFHPPKQPKKEIDE